VWKIDKLLRESNKLSFPADESASPSQGKESYVSVRTSAGPHEDDEELKTESDTESEDEFEDALPFRAPAHKKHTSVAASDTSEQFDDPSVDDTDDEPVAFEAIIPPARKDPPMNVSFGTYTPDAPLSDPSDDEESPTDFGPHLMAPAVQNFLAYNNSRNRAVRNLAKDSPLRNSMSDSRPRGNRSALQAQEIDESLASVPLQPDKADDDDSDDDDDEAPPSGVCPNGRRCKKKRTCGHDHSGKPLCRYGNQCRDKWHGCDFAHIGIDEPKIVGPPNAWNLPHETNSMYPSVTLACLSDPIPVRTQEEADIVTSHGFWASICSMNENDHSRQAIERTILIRKLIISAYGLGHRVFQLHYDFSRIERVMRRFNLICNLYGKNKFVFQRVYAIRSQQDLLRVPVNKSIDESDMTATCAIFHDQYKDLNVHTVERTLLTLSGVSVDAGDIRPLVIIAALRFCGPMGVSNGQPWVRRSDGNVTSVIDATLGEVEHPSLDFLREPDSNIAFVHGGNVGLKDFYLAFDISQLPDLSDEHKGGFIQWTREETAILPGKTWSSQLVEAYKKRQLMQFASVFCDFKDDTLETVISWNVHREVYAELVDDLGYLANNVRVGNTVQAEVAKKLNDDEQYSLFKRHFPNEASLLLESTVQAVEYAKKPSMNLAQEEIQKDMNSTLFALKERAQATLVLADDDLPGRIMPIFVLTLVSALCLYGNNHFVHVLALIGWTFYESSIFGRMWRTVGPISAMERSTLSHAVKMISIYLGQVAYAWFLRDECAWNEFECQTTILYDELEVDRFMVLYYLGAWLLASLVACSPWVTHFMWNLALVSFGVPWTSPLYALVIPIPFMQYHEPNDFWTCSHCGAEHWEKHVECPSCGTRRNAKAATTAWDTFKSFYDSEQFASAHDVRGYCAIPFRSLLKSCTPLRDLWKLKTRDIKIKLWATCGTRVLHPDTIKPDKKTDCIQPLILTQECLLAPTPGIYANLSSCDIRNCRLTPQTDRPDLWDDVAAQMAKIFAQRDSSPLAPDDIIDWINSYDDPIKRRDLMEFWMDCKVGLRTSHYDPQLGPLSKTKLKTFARKNKMFAKTNEVLRGKVLRSRKIGYGIRIGVKPRTIQSVHSSVLVSCQPYILAATRRFKAVIKEPFDMTLNGTTKRFFLTYASGMVEDDMTRWLVKARKHAQEGTICFIVNGDDSLTVMTKDGREEYIEADYSHFDQSQKSVQNRAELLILASLGVPQGICDILALVGRASAVGQKRNPKIPYRLHFKPSGANRVTGAPNTSISNTTNNALGLIIASFYDFSDEGWKHVGFTAVTVRSSTVQETTFLRGTWWPHGDGTERWGILPSAVLKLGKVMAKRSDPGSVFKYAYGMAAGMGDVPDHFPVLGAFRKKLFNLGREGAPIRNKFKPMSQMNETLDREFVLEWMYDRYGITTEEVEEVEDMINKIPSLPYFIGHDIFTKLAEDY
jgi:DNA-directed RNA polymerase subunit RPC12/RpoP